MPGPDGTTRQGTAGPGRHRHGAPLPALLTLYVGIVTAASLRLTYALLAIGVAVVFARAPRAWLVQGHRFLLPAAGVASLAALGFALHPYTRHVAHPSTGPDAMIVPVQRLLRGIQPYAGALWDGAPISPGPGWLLLNAPFSATGLIVLVTPFWLAVAAWLLARRDAAAASLFTLALFASRDVLVQSIVGHDIVAINLAVTVLCLLLPACRDNRAWLPPIAILAGLIATARLPLILIIPILGLALWRHDRRTGAWFTATALLVAASLHAGFAIWAARDGAAYQPLHVFSRARHGAGPVFMVAGAAGGAIAGLATLRIALLEPGAVMLCCWLFEFLAFAPIGLGELASVGHWHTAGWEGRNYVIWSLPLLCGYLSLRAAGPTELGPTV